MVQKRGNVYSLYTKIIMNTFKLKTEWLKFKVSKNNCFFLLFTLHASLCHHHTH